MLVIICKGAAWSKHMKKWNTVSEMHDEMLTPQTTTYSTSCSLSTITIANSQFSGRRHFWKTLCNRSVFAVASDNDPGTLSEFV